MRYQLQYFCRKAGIKQDRSALWVTAFEKILSKQEAVLKDLGGRIEQFAPLDLHSPSVQLANEIVSAARSCEGQRSGTRGGFPGTRDSRATATADDGPVPIARSKGPGQPISGKVRPSFSHFPPPLVLQEAPSNRKRTEDVGQDRCLFVFEGTPTFPARRNWGSDTRLTFLAHLLRGRRALASKRQGKASDLHEGTVTAKMSPTTGTGVGCASSR